MLIASIEGFHNRYEAFATENNLKKMSSKQSEYRGPNGRILSVVHLMNKRRVWRQKSDVKISDQLLKFRVHTKYKKLLRDMHQPKWKNITFAEVDDNFNETIIKYAYPKLGILVIPKTFEIVKEELKEKDQF